MLILFEYCVQILIFFKKKVNNVYIYNDIEIETEI